MINFSSVKLVARAATDEQDNEVVQIPLSVWEAFISELGEAAHALNPDDLGWLELAGQSFAFWGNDEDAGYDL